MSDRPAPPDPHPGVVDRIAEWLFPSLCPDVPAERPCIEPEAGP
jgi:hypothetical protein